MKGLPTGIFQMSFFGLLMYWNTRMVHLWKDGEEKPFPNLRFLKFYHSWSLRSLDLSVAPNLETLILENCPNLEEVHFQVTPNLKELHIHFCWRLEKIHMPAETPNLTSLNLSNLDKLRTLHLGITPNLETIRIEYCNDLVKLHNPAECPKLVNLTLRNCMQFAELPDEIGRSECLKELDITGTIIGHLPPSIFRVKGLRIVGSKWILVSCGFNSEIFTSSGETFCYI